MKTISLKEKLRHHVTGAIERGEAEAIAGIPAPLHTPGPWYLNNDCVHIRNGVTVQPVTHHMDARGIADARLISAAPDLLSALRFLLADYIAIGGENFTGSSVPIKIAQSAILKAEGLK